nr:hypothetical protein CFP56_25945 [Quercus suber]
MSTDSTSTDSSSWTSPGAGITGDYNGNSEILRIFIVFFAGLAMYNACELIIMVHLTFLRKQGLYFWSLLVAAAAIIPYSIGFLLKFMNITSGNTRWLSITLITLGWWPMVTGQSVVLWSRLHLIVNGNRGDRIIRWTMWMIIIDAIILHIPTTVLTFGSNGDHATRTYETGYNVMEKETTLSSIYIFETIKILRTSLQPRTRTTMKQLIAINAVIIAMDVGLLGLECASLYILETLLKSVIYSIKLKLEFAILGKLVKFVGASTPKEEVQKLYAGHNAAAECHCHRNASKAHAIRFSSLKSDLARPSVAADSLEPRRKSTRSGEATGLRIRLRALRTCGKHSNAKRDQP